MEYTNIVEINKNNNVPTNRKYFKYIGSGFTHIGYMHMREVDAIRHDIYFDGSKYFVQGLGDLQKWYTVQDHWKDRINQGKYIVITLDKKTVKFVDPN